MAREVKLATAGWRWSPGLYVAEIGVNHNGSIEIAKKLIARGPSQRRRCGQVPEAHARAVRAARPVGYHARNALGLHQLHRIPPQDGIPAGRVCRDRPLLPGTGHPWFASVWDEPSVEFLEAFNPICYKVPSASLTDHSLLRCLRDTGRPVILSTGMSTMEQIARRSACWIWTNWCSPTPPAPTPATRPS
jgi:N-acetylneuraminate synthase